jgi:glycosyltransferase involved in cell wall biosynthesis
VKTICQEWNPDVAHVHNLFVSASPSILHAATRSGVPVVMTLHNYRQICANGLLFRGGKTCVECLGKPVSLAGVWHGCYRDSHLQSAAMATITGVHNLIGTWRNQVDHYVALSSFSRDIFLTAGLPGDRISVKPNFVDLDPGEGDGAGGYAFFAGRLADYKGVEVLLEAWRGLPGNIALKIAGTGPLEDQVKAIAAADPRVQYLGGLDRESTSKAMKSARFLVFPSINFENFPMVIVEAFSTGLPVVASRIGGLGSIVRHGRNGLLFDSGNMEGLAAAMNRMFEMGGREYRSMRAAARGDYFELYAAPLNRRTLATIYEQAIEYRRRLGMGRPESLLVQ